MDIDQNYEGVTTIAEARELLKKIAAQVEGGQCPCCNHRVRDDKKSLNKWMVTALAELCRYFDENPTAKSVHAASLLEGTPGAKNHDVATLRWWGLIREEEGPEDSTACGSRGLSGWWSVTPLGRSFRDGEMKVTKNVIRKFGEPGYTPVGRLISFEEALRARLRVGFNNIVLDGTTVVGPEERSRGGLLFAQRN
jgi:hypothetical protein